MMGRVTLRELREALATAKAKGAKASTRTPIIEELKSLARRLEREGAAGNRRRLGSRRTARPRSTRRR